jgi:hypothetical protein
MLLVGMFQDIEQVSPFDVKDHLFERYSAFPFEAFVLLVIPRKVLHARRLSLRVPFGNIPRRRGSQSEGPVDV